MAAPSLLRGPEPLQGNHQLETFENGVHPLLDEWLQNRALLSEGLSARTYVVCPVAEARRVVGYFCISTAMEQRLALPTAKLRRGMPDHVPLLLLGRLAVDTAWRGKGLGSMLLADAMQRCLAVSEIAGARAIVAHAIDDQAVAFYERHGFVRSPLGERVMLIPMEAARAVLRP